MNTNTKLALATAIACGALPVTVAAPAHAAPPGTYLVTSTSGSCAGQAGSLYWAVQQANADGLDSTIDFSAALAGKTIALQCALTVTDDLTWNGVASLKILSSGLPAGSSAITFAAPGAVHSVTDLYLVGGNGTRGIKIAQGQSVDLTTSTIASNSLAAGNGAGIDVEGSFLLVDTCLITGNQAPGAGGGIHGHNSKVVLYDSSIYKNGADSGGGLSIEAPNGHITVEGTTFYGNASAKGGGIALWNGGASTTMDVVNSTFSANGSSAVGSVGGALYVSSVGFSPDPDVTLANTSFSNNAAQLGSGIAVHDGMVWGYNSALYRTAGTGANCYRFVGADIGGDHNVWNDLSCPLGTVWTGSKPNTNPLLGSLAANGGPTLTTAPLPGSPMISTGDPQWCPPVDQRGVARTTCWMGSVEN